MMKRSVADADSALARARLIIQSVVMSLHVRLLFANLVAVSGEISATRIALNCEVSTIIKGELPRVKI